MKLHSHKTGSKALFLTVGLWASDRVVYPSSKPEDDPARITGSFRLFVTDHLSSIRIVLDERSVTTERCEYQSDGAPLRAISGAVVPRYTGMEPNAWGFYGNRARLYDPSLMSWLSADPLYLAGSSSSELNLYNYTLRNPLRYVDTTGLKTTPANPFNPSTMNLSRSWNQFKDVPMSRDVQIDHVLYNLYRAPRSNLNIHYDIYNPPAKDNFGHDVRGKFQGWVRADGTREGSITLYGPFDDGNAMAKTTSHEFGHYALFMFPEIHDKLNGFRREIAADMIAIAWINDLEAAGVDLQGLDVDAIRNKHENHMRGVMNNHGYGDYIIGDLQPDVDHVIENLQIGEGP